MTNTQKQSTKEAIELLKAQGESQNAIANKIGISPANITQILKGNWENISDKLWRKVASSLNITSHWQPAPTYNFKKIQGICKACQTNNFAKLIAAEAGMGKTFALRQYATNHSEVYYIQCERDYTRKVFLAKLGKSIGLHLTGTAFEMIEDIIEALKTKQTPLLIFDEFDKILDKDGIFNVFKRLYDATLYRCGFVLCGTNALRINLNKRLKKDKIGYKELYSRCGRRIENLKDISQKDVRLVCQANSIEDTNIRDLTIELGQGDYRELYHIIKLKQSTNK